jgi:LysR family glycine cleavage system transcriptional activator
MLLGAFEAAAKHCHLGRAGQELGVTQGAISQQVCSLEEFLSATLFQRVSNRLQLTSAGKRLQHSVSQGLDVIMEGVLHLDPEIMSGELTIKLEQILPFTTELPNNMDIIICYGKPSNKELVIRKLFDGSFFR